MKSQEWSTSLIRLVSLRERDTKSVQGSMWGHSHLQIKEDPGKPNLQEPLS